MSGARWIRRQVQHLAGDDGSQDPAAVGNYFGIVTASLGLLLFIPQIIKSLGTTNMGTGYATTLAYTCAAISMITWGWLADRMGERRWHLLRACRFDRVGLVLAG